MVVVAVFGLRATVQTQALMALLVVLLAASAHVALKPFDVKILDKLELYGLITAFTTLYMGMFFFTRDVEESPFFLAVVTIIILSTNFAFITYWGLSLYGALRQEVVCIGQVDVRLRSQYRSCCAAYCSCCTCNLANSYHRCCKKIRRFGKRHRIGGRDYNDSDEDDDNGHIFGEHVDNTVWSSMVDRNSLTRKESLKSIHKSKSKSRQKQKRTGLQLEEIKESNDFMIRRKKFKKENEKAKKLAKLRRQRARAMMQQLGLEHTDSNFPEGLDIQHNPLEPTTPLDEYHNNPLARSRWKNAFNKSIIKKPTNSMAALLMIDQGKKQQQEAHKMEHEALKLIKKGEEFLRQRKKTKKEPISKKHNWHKAMNKLRLVTGKAGEKGSKQASALEMVDLESNHQNNEVSFNPMHSNKKNKKKEAKDKGEAKSNNDNANANRMSSWQGRSPLEDALVSVCAQNPPSQSAMKAAQDVAVKYQREYKHVIYYTIKFLAQCDNKEKLCVIYFIDCTVRHYKKAVSDLGRKILARFADKLNDAFVHFKQADANVKRKLTKVWTAWKHREIFPAPTLDKVANTCDLFAAPPDNDNVNANVNDNANDNANGNAKAVAEKELLRNKGETHSNDNVEIHRDDKTGRRYSCNMTTGESIWINDEDENQDNEAIKIHRDDKTGRRYSVNAQSGVSKWLEEDEQTKVVGIFKDDKTGCRYSVNESGETKWLDDLAMNHDDDNTSTGSSSDQDKTSSSDSDN